jgi:hypothetical protein
MFGFHGIAIITSAMCVPSKLAGFSAVLLVPGDRFCLID